MLVNNIHTLVDILIYRSLHQPNKTAYTFLVDGEVEEVSITYHELAKRAQNLAAHLQLLGFSGERALILYQPGLEYIIAFFACLYAGVVAVPAYPPRLHKPMPRLDAIVADAQAKVALTTRSILDNLEPQFPQNPRLASLYWLTSDTITDDFTSTWQQPQIKSETLAFLQYTSGSTGIPKGVMVSHGNLLHNSSVIYQCFGHTDESLGLIWLPPYHDMGLIGGILQPLYGGFLVVLVPTVYFLQRPASWLKAISRYKATTSGGPNFAYDLCIRKITEKQKENLDLSSWSVAFNGAEAIRFETQEQFAQKFASCGFRIEAFYPCYGMAESTLLISGGRKIDPPVIAHVDVGDLQHNQVSVLSDINVIEKTTIRKLVSSGQAQSNQIIIVDPESLTMCRSGQVGEIWVSSPSVALGYWQQITATQNTFSAYIGNQGPFLRTGDLGFLQDGELFVTGRLKDTIIIRGRNHYPQDIEITVAESHPALISDGGAAFSVDINGEERLVVVHEVERQYLRKLDIKEVVGNIRQQITAHHDLQPYAVVLIKPSSLPRTSSGKVQRFACRAGFLAGSLNLVDDWSETPPAKLVNSSKEVGLVQQIQLPN